MSRTRNRAGGRAKSAEFCECVWCLWWSMDAVLHVNGLSAQLTKNVEHHLRGISRLSSAACSQSAGTDGIRYAPMLQMAWDLQARLVAGLDPIATAATLLSAFQPEAAERTRQLAGPRGHRPGHIVCIQVLRRAHSLCMAERVCLPSRVIVSGWTKIMNIPNNDTQISDLWMTNAFLLAP